MGDPESGAAKPAAVTVLAGIDMFEVEFDWERHPGVECVVKAGPQGNGPAVQPGMVRIAALRAERGVEPQGRQQAHAAAHPGADPVAVALAA